MSKPIKVLVGVVVIVGVVVKIRSKNFLIKNNSCREIIGLEVLDPKKFGSKKSGPYSFGPKN